MELLKTLLPILTIDCIFGFVCRGIVSAKRYPKSKNHGFARGFFFGPLGIIICAFKKRYVKRRTTPKSANPPAKPNYKGIGGTYGGQTPYKNESRTITKENFTSKLNSLKDSQDKSITSTAENRRLASGARTYRADKKRTYTTTKTGEMINIDLGWSENVAELLEATEVVCSNAEMSCNSRLQSERFDYYTYLHSRLATAADLCQAKIEEIARCEAQIRRIVSRLNDRSDSLHVDKAVYYQLVSLRNTTGDILNLLRDRRCVMPSLCANLRDKIRDECGTRGREWYERLRERSEK